VAGPDGSIMASGRAPAVAAARMDGRNGYPLGSMTAPLRRVSIDGLYAVMMYHRQ
jgi:hypothetical protein